MPIRSKSFGPSRPLILLLLASACGREPRGAGQLARVLVNPVSTSVQVGDSVQLTATLLDSTGTPLSPGAVSWESSHIGVATVSPVGLVTGVGVGAVKVTASSGGASGWAVVTVTKTGPGPETLVGAGDIADCSLEEDEATAKLLDRIPGTVFTAGDNAYPNGTPANFADCYGPTWGRHRERTRPSPGNHDHRMSGAAGYFGYFGGAAPYYYYSYDLGAWHIVSLDSEIEAAAGSPQEQWLRADLAATTRRCTLAYWHRPRFSSSSGHGGNPGMQPLWQALYEAHAEIVLAGHNHDYERFAPQTPAGAADPTNGIREFVVGTGGAERYGFAGPLPNSEVRDSATFGVLKLVLSPGSYSWQFIPVAGAAFTDSGSGSCH